MPHTNITRQLGCYGLTTELRRNRSAARENNAGQPRNGSDAIQAEFQHVARAKTKYFKLVPSREPNFKLGKKPRNEYMK